MLGNTALRTKIIISNGIPLALIVLLVATSCLSVRFLLRTTATVDNAHEVVEQAFALEGLAADLESAERGFLITGQQSYLDAYALVQERLAQRFDVTEALVADDPEQARQLAQVESLLTRWQNEAARQEIAVRRRVVGGAKDSRFLKRMLKEGPGGGILVKLSESLASLDVRFRKASNE